MFMLAGRASVSPACLDVFPVNSLVHEGKLNGSWRFMHSLSESGPILPT